LRSEYIYFFKEAYSFILLSIVYPICNWYLGSFVFYEILGTHTQFGWTTLVTNIANLMWYEWKIFPFNVCQISN